MGKGVYHHLVNSSKVGIPNMALGLLCICSCWILEEGTQFPSPWVNWGKLPTPQVYQIVATTAVATPLPGSPQRYYH